MLFARTTYLEPELFFLIILIYLKLELFLAVNFILAMFLPVIKILIVFIVNVYV
jgi:hypothetical protein